MGNRLRVRDRSDREIFVQVAGGRTVRLAQGYAEHERETLGAVQGKRSGFVSGDTSPPGDDDRLPRAPMGAEPGPVRARITRIVRMLLGRSEYASPEQVQARVAEVVPRVADLSSREFHARVEVHLSD